MNTDLKRARLFARGLSEKEIQRALCEHDYGDMCQWTFMGCTRTCTKCGQMQCDPNHCGQYDAARKRR
ncbi:hypothetical protein AKJ09_03700 [Labilithrix luteola]|uniref:Uncharacterized protein n=1 Tax=Labilithrix luteola TaxID=1391654 RepID=A0A0K1PUI8_9BACT|nr:hypothetical protein [Labilithrix luteola]AKU97036.1 hypothetical protein AKJ09_03700 [Labilithrix luteola]